MTNFYTHTVLFEKCALIAAVFFIFVILFRSRVENWFSNVMRAVFFEDRNRYIKFLTEPIEGPVSIEREVGTFCKGDFDGRLLFVVGGWGSGKTHHVMKYFGSSKIKFIYKSFFGIQTLDEAYQHLLVWWWQLLLVIIPFGLFIYLGLFNFIFSEKETYLGFLTMVTAGILLLVFVRNKMKMFSLLGFTVFTFFRKRIIVVDDLDRSSMSEADQWAMLSNLWRMNTNYVVLLGYSNDEQKESVLELAHKMGGEVILLHTDQETNLILARKYDAEFPFSGDDSDFETHLQNSLDWLNYITPRKLVATIDEVKRDLISAGTDREPLRLFLYLTKFVDSISNSLNLMPFDRQKMDFDVANGINGGDQPANRKQIRFNTGTEPSPPLALDVVKKIYRSLKLTDKAKIESVALRVKKEDFPSFLRFNMPAKELSRLYKTGFEAVETRR